MTTCCIFFLSSLIATIGTGCSIPTNTSFICYNSSQKNTYTFQSYTVAWNEDFSELLCTNSADGDTVDLLQTLLPTEKDALGKAMFGWGDTVYLLEIYEDDKELLLPSAYSNNVNLTLVALNLKNATRKICFETNGNSEETALAYYTDTFFCNSHSLFLVQNQESILEIDLLTGTSTLLDISITASNNIAFDGEAIYYKDSDDALLRYSVTNHTTEAVSNLTIYDFVLAPECVYYINRMDRDTVYCYPFASGKVKKLSNTPVTSIRMEGKQLICSSKSGRESFTIMLQ